MVLSLESTPPPDLGLIFGPILLGSLFNWGLFGILGLQTYLYFHWFPRDRNVLKWLVATLFVLDTFQTVVSTHTTWYMLVAGWGNNMVLFLPPWSLCVAVMLSGIISATVQMFFAHRVWMLSKSIPVSIVIIAVSLTQCISAITGASQILLLHVDNSKQLSTFDAFAIWLSGSAVCDVIIACSMVYFLFRARPKTAIQSTDTLITRLINNSIQSGSVTAVCAAVDLILFLKFKTNNLHDVPFFMLGKLYSNTLIANLNARRSRTAIPVPQATETVLTDPVNMGFWIQNSTQDTRGTNINMETVRDTTSSRDETEVTTTANTSKGRSHHDCFTDHGP